MTHKELVDIAYGWVLRNTSCGIAFKELDCACNNGEVPDVIGFSSWDYSIVIECKVSRNDFLSDRKKSFRANPSLGMGKYRFYCCETGLIKPEDLPACWGLVYVNEKNKARVAVNPYGSIEKFKNSKLYSISRNGFAEYNAQAERQLLYSALRRLFLRGYMPEIYKPLSLGNEQNNPAQ